MSAQKPAGLALNVSRLVELDMAFLGRRVILAEFAVAVVGSAALAAFSLSYAARMHSPLWSWPVLLGLELAAVGVNYVPLLLEAWRRHSDARGIAAVKSSLRGNAQEARSYGLRQAWILVPGAVVLFALRARD